MIKSPHGKFGQKTRKKHSSAPSRSAIHHASSSPAPFPFPHLPYSLNLIFLIPLSSPFPLQSRSLPVPFPPSPPTLLYLQIIANEHNSTFSSSTSLSPLSSSSSSSHSPFPSSYSTSLPFPPTLFLLGASHPHPLHPRCPSLPNHLALFKQGSPSHTLPPSTFPLKIPPLPAPLPISLPSPPKVSQKRKFHHPDSKHFFRKVSKKNIFSFFFPVPTLSQHLP